MLGMLWDEAGRFMGRLSTLGRLRLCQSSLARFMACDQTKPFAVLKPPLLSLYLRILPY